MDVMLKGAGTRVALAQRDFKGQGGEGSVYVKGGVAYKIYTDPSRMLPLGKIQELSRLTAPNIIRPLDVLLDIYTAAPIGYTMRAVEGWTLCQLFPKAFWDRENVTGDRVLPLVQQLRDGVEHLHQQRILGVDLNENNFIVSPNFKELYFIDVDSFQTPSFPATAVIDSIYDRKYATGVLGQPGFKYQVCEESDWFSLAIVIFQLLTGIHPYKGKHPSIRSLHDRMLANVSVLNSSVSVPPVCRPLAHIPPAYMQWFHQLFERGERLAPPTTISMTGPAVAFTARPATQSVNIVMTRIFQLSADAQLIWHQDGETLLTGGCVLAGRQYPIAGMKRHAYLATLPNGRHALALRSDMLAHTYDILQVETKLPIMTPTGTPGLSAEQMMAYDSRLYAKSGDGIYEVRFVEFGGKLTANLFRVANTMEQATQLYAGVALQNVLGTCYATIFPKSGMSHQLRLRELEGMRVIDAKYMSQVLVVIAEHGGKYARLVFRFAAGFQDYDLRSTTMDTVDDVNFTVLDNGLVLLMTEQDELECFTNRRDSTTFKVIADPALDRTFRLFKDGQRALAVNADGIYHISTK